MPSSLDPVDLADVLARWEAGTLATAIATPAEVDEVRSDLEEAAAHAVHAAGDADLASNPIRLSKRRITELAACERHGRDGEAALLGMAVGAETLCRLSLVAPRLIHKAGFHPTAVLGAMGAAAGVSATLGLDRRQIVDALGNGRARAGQEARAHAVGHLAEAEVEARRLDLVAIERVGGNDGAAFGERRDHVVGQDASLARCKGERHSRALLRDAHLRWARQSFETPTFGGLLRRGQAIPHRRLDGKVPPA